MTYELTKIKTIVRRTWRDLKELHCALNSSYYCSIDFLFYGGRNMNKEFKDLDEQINILKTRNLIIKYVVVYIDTYNVTGYNINI